MKSKDALTILVTILLTLFVVYYLIPAWVQPTVPSQQYSQTLPLKVNVAHWANESWVASDAYGATLNIYDLNWNLKETISISSGLFTSSFYYQSGETLRYKFSCTGYETKTGTFTIPYYDDPNQPLSGYHSISAIEVAYTPSTKCTFSVNGAYNTSAIVTYDRSVSGNTISISLEFYNTLDESRLYNYEDAVYEYEPLVVVKNAYYNSTCTPLKIKIQGLEQVQAETASSSGIYIYQPTENSLNRNKNQATGSLIENNRITVTFTIDVTQLTSGLGIIQFYLYDSVDIDYFRTYGATQSGASTLQSPTTFNMQIVP
ncbi:MAG: hypothetical protein ACTSRS_18940 [Candidatus Helarchaeota archaeon]